MGIDICTALELCYNKSVIHKDIKTANIFISEDGNYKLGDFGVAKTAAKTQRGTYAGTEQFMAPEVSAGKEVKLKFDVEPLEVRVTYWSTDAWEDFSVEGGEILLYENSFTVGEEDTIYEIWARWQGNDSEGGTLSGNVYYSFYTDVK